MLGFDTKPLLWMRLDRNGEIRDVNAFGEQMLQRPREELVGIDVRDLTDASRRETMAAMINAARSGDASTADAIALTRKDGKPLPLVAVIHRANADASERGLQLWGIDDRSSATRIGELESRAEMLAGIIDASSEAMWCLEFTEPLDLRASIPEIIRQVYENQSYLRLCNQAMARLYNLPVGIDLSRQPITAYFPRSAENEAYLRQLIDARFDIDAARSVERRHDGRVIYVENSVRSHIEDGLLYRMWGTVHDITDLRVSQNSLMLREQAVTDILAALPDAVVVVDINRTAIALNPGFEATLGWRADEILGKSVDSFIDLEAPRAGLGRWFGPVPSRWATNVLLASGESRRCDVRIAPMPANTERRFVLSIRLERLESARRSPNRRGKKNITRATRPPLKRGAPRSRG